MAITQAQSVVIKSATPLLSVRGMTVAYHDTPVIRDVSLDIPKGSLTAILGPNGAGKSTLLQAMMGLVPKLCGDVTFNGESLRRHRAELAYMPQRSSVNWDFPTTVLDVALMGRYVHLGWCKRPRKEDYRIAREALARLGMEAFADRQISQLSGGQRQRVFLARALAQEASCYIMDEPLAGIDKKTEGMIMDFLREVQAQGGTSIVVHHDLHTVASYFDHVVLLNQTLIAQGPTAETFRPEVIQSVFQMNWPHAWQAQ